jgi:hypothetical protein
MWLSQKYSRILQNSNEPGVWATRADARRQLPVHMGYLPSIWQFS